MDRVTVDPTVSGTPAPLAVRLSPEDDDPDSGAGCGPQSLSADSKRLPVDTSLSGLSGREYFMTLLIGQDG